MPLEKMPLINGKNATGRNATGKNATLFLFYFLKVSTFFFFSTISEDQAQIDVDTLY